MHGYCKDLFYFEANILLPISNYTFDFLITQTLVRMFSKASRITNTKKLKNLVLANKPILTL